jgi:protein-tyrosine-phosphatase
LSTSESAESIGHDSASAGGPPARDLETQLELRKITTDLAYRYDGVFSKESVQQVVEESYDLLSNSAKVKSFLPMLTERFAKERLLAVAQAEGRVAKPTPEVLFICVQNAGRSQMAAGFLNHLSGGRVHVRSAGSLPGSEVNPIAAAAMAEIGIKMTEAFPKPLTDDVVRAADVIVTMGCGDTCPVYPGKRYLDWDLADPDGLPLAKVRPIRDDIEQRVRNLLSEILPL